MVEQKVALLKTDASFLAEVSLGRNLPFYWTEQRAARQTSEYLKFAYYFQTRISCNRERYIMGE